MSNADKLPTKAGTSGPVTASGNSPPPYKEQAESETTNINAAFENLNLSSTIAQTTPTADQCLAHLKLLFAFQSLKEDVGYTDGLFGLWDSLAGPLEEKKSVEAKMQDKQLQLLSQIREKR